MKNFLHKYKIDIIVVTTLFLISLLASSVILLSRKKGNLVADIYHHSDVVETVHLSNESGLRQFIVDGDHGEVIVEVKKNAIRVASSSCPHKDCVNIGWVSSTGQPIICAYNAISILLSSADSFYDVEV